MTLTEFLLARINEDEALADALLYPPPGHYDKGWQADRIRAYASRTLDECEGKRQIVELMRNTIALYGLRVSPNGRGDDADRVLRYLAQPYAEHPDFDPAWRP